MATIKVSIPGVGGSLGECVVCGQSFAKEIMLGESVGSLGIEGIDANLPVHHECAETVTKMCGKWKDIRDAFPEGPLKKCFDEQLAGQEAEARDAQG